MLTDFIDISWECTWFYLQQTGIIPFFILWYNVCIDITISETVKFFKQLRHAMQGRRCKTNGQNIQIIQESVQWDKSPSFIWKLFNKFFLHRDL